MNHSYQNDYISVSILYENYQMGKYANLEISDKKVNPEKQQLILNNIMKRLPMSTIVLSQHVVNDKTIFHVIRGKEKLEAIFNIIEHEGSKKAVTSDPIFGDKEKAIQFWHYKFPVLHYYGIHEDYEEIHQILTALEV